MSDFFKDIPDYESDELNEPYEPEEPDYSTDEEEQSTDEFTEDSDEVEPVDDFMEDSADFDEQNTTENFDFHDETSEEATDKSESSEEKQALLNEFVGIISTLAVNEDEPDEDRSDEDEITGEELNEDELDEEEPSYEDTITRTNYSAYKNSDSESDRPWESNNNSPNNKSIVILLGIIAVIVTLFIAFGIPYIRNITDKAEKSTNKVEHELNSFLGKDNKPLFKTSDYSKDFDDENKIYFNGCEIVLRETTLSELGSELGIDFTEENTDVINEFDDTAQSMSYIETDGTEDIYIEGYYDGPATEADLPNFVVTEVSFTVDSVESFDFFGVTQDSTPEEIVEAVGDPYLTSESYYGTEYTWVTTFTYLTIDYDENNEIVHIRVFNTP